MQCNTMNMDKMSSIRILNHNRKVAIQVKQMVSASGSVCACMCSLLFLLNLYVMYWILSRFSIQASLNIWHNWDDQPNKSIGEPIYDSRHSFFSFHLTHLVWLFGINFQVFLSMFLFSFHFSSSHCLRFKCDVRSQWGLWEPWAMNDRLRLYLRTSALILRLIKN